MKSEIFFYFLKLGTLGFGGPLSLIAQMQVDLIEKKKWMPHEEFLTALPIIKAMPGPIAFQETRDSNVKIRFSKKHLRFA